MRKIIDEEQNKRLRVDLKNWIEKEERNYSWIAKKLNISKSLLTLWKQEKTNISKPILDEMELIISY